MLRIARLFAVTAPLVLLTALPASAASFNCHKARTESEKAICAKTTLNVLDQRMGKVFRTLLAKVGHSGQRDQFIADQQYWLSVRDGCNAEADCLRVVYHDRIKELNGYIAAVKAAK